MKTVTKQLSFFELQQSEDGRSYNTIATIDSSIGYEKAREIAEEIRSDFKKYEGSFYRLQQVPTKIEFITI